MSRNPSAKQNQKKAKKQPMSSVVVKDEKARAEEALKNVNEAFAGDKVALNLRTVYFSRIILSIAVGVSAGVLGVTNLAGFAVYALAIAAHVLTVAAAAGGAAGVRATFVSRMALVSEGFSASILTYILFWTLFYGIVHLY
eukprot:TRINITY_DN9213_c0_g1_i1.p2 TRINITY_DN9213_c0_g1~~TRINITY_DN9213_c0_g1_i1.p2  ORF type:complete len:141 (+),score=54.93 TRINITY_DN9213_c0_g1_i1:67-489(+)